MRIVDVYYDVIAGCLRDSAGIALRRESYPYVYYKEQILIRLRLVINSTLAPFTDLTAAMPCSAAIDKTYSTTTPMIKTANSGINVPLDWSSASKPTGMLSIRIDANTTEFHTAIAANAELTNTYFELQAFDPAGTLAAIFQMPFRCLNIIDDNGATPTPAPTLGTFQFFQRDSDGAWCLRIVSPNGDTLRTFEPMV